MFTKLQEKKRSNGAPHNITEAIRSFEEATMSKASELESVLGKDYKQVKQVMEDLKPYAEEIGENIADSAYEKIDQGWDATKRWSHEVDRQVHENSWKALAAASFIALALGYLIGRRD